MNSQQKIICNELRRDLPVKTHIEIKTIGKNVQCDILIINNLSKKIDYKSWDIKRFINEAKELEKKSNKPI